MLLRTARAAPRLLRTAPRHKASSVAAARQRASRLHDEPLALLGHQRAERREARGEHRREGGALGLPACKEGPLDMTFVLRILGMSKHEKIILKGSISAVSKPIFASKYVSI